MNAQEENIYFTADLHLNHDNVIGFNDRPFEDVREMNETIVETWNSFVDNDDHVFVLGDVALGNPRHLTDLLYTLNGNLYLIRGNHEKAVMKSRENRSRFVWIDDNYILKERSTGATIYMHHYPHRTWRDSHRGSWHLYGHEHADIEHIEWGKSMDVGVDNAYRLFGEFRPFSFKEVEEKLKRREIIRHH